jgi:hypothetical protein
VEEGDGTRGEDEETTTTSKVDNVAVTTLLLESKGVESTLAGRRLCVNVKTSYRDTK